MPILSYINNQIPKQCVRDVLLTKQQVNAHTHDSTAHADIIHSEQIDAERFVANLSCLQSVISSNATRNDISLENIVPDAKIQSLNATSLIKTNDSAMHDVILN